MNRRIMKLSLIVSVLALLCLAPSLRLMAQDTTTQQVFADKGVESNSTATHRRYILKDLGTLGGPGSSVGFFAKVLNNRGTVVGNADTSTPDPFAPNCLGPNCFVQHGFKWERGIKTDLGTLPGGSSSDANWINELGQITGRSQNGLIDPLTGIPATVAVLWKANGRSSILETWGEIRAWQWGSITAARWLARRPIQSLMPLRLGAFSTSASQHRHGPFYGSAE